MADVDGSNALQLTSFVGREREIAEVRVVRFVAEGTAEAFGSGAEIDESTKNRQMPQQTGLVQAMAFGDGAPAAPAAGTGKRAFDGEDELAMLVQLGLEDAHVGDVERNRNERMLGHYGSSFITGETRPDSALSRSVAQPLHLEAFMASPGEPS